MSREHQFPLKQFVVKYDAMGNPFLVDTNNHQTWHIGQRVMANGMAVTLLIDSFYIEGTCNSHKVKPIDNNRTFNNVQALLKTADEVKQGYANINTLKSLESPNYSYSTDIQPNTANNNYKYLLISN